MNRMIAQLSLVVRDYDEAIDFYVTKLGFVLIEDTPLSDTKRWVVVAPSAEAAGARLLLAKAVGEEQMSRVGDQTGGRVFLFLHTDDIVRDHAQLVAAGVRVVREPAAMPYGTVLVFADLYGNLWDMIQPLTV
jgi:catechol 2,3-dioxygenase-like lactoylglutathione lyase family enzyme